MYELALMLRLFALLLSIGLYGDRPYRPPYSQVCFIMGGLAHAIPPPKIELPLRSVPATL